MKHKRLAVAITSVLFAAVVLLSGWVVCTVSKVTVKYTWLTVKTEEEIKSQKQKLDSLSGTSMFTVDESGIRTALEGNPYIIVESVKVVFPSTVTVSVRERAEAFCVFDGEHYYQLTEDGFVLSCSDENATRLDGKPNALITGEVPPLTVNSACPEDKLFRAAVMAVNAFDDVRNELESVKVSRTAEGGTGNWNRIMIKTATGCEFTITEADKDTEDKVALLKELYYERIEGEDRVAGKYDIFSKGDGVVDFDTSR